MENTIDRKSISRSIMAIVWPTALGFVLQQGYALVDSLVLGRFLGKEALAAIGGTNLGIINLVITMFAGFSTGPMVVISQQLGRGERDKVGKTVGNSLLASLVIGLVLLAVIQFSATWIHRVMGTPSDVLTDSVTYLRWYFIGLVPMLVFNMGSSMFRAMGKPNVPLKFLAVCTVTNLALDLLFVVVLGGGVRGAAIASGISQLLSAALVLISLRKLEGGMAPSFRRGFVDKAIIKKILGIGIPTGVQNALYFLSGLMMSYCVNLLGTDYVAAWAIVFRFDSLFWAISSSFSIAVTNVSGTFYGAKDSENLRRCSSVGMLCYLGATLPFCTLLALTRNVSPLLFTSDINVVTETSRVLLYMALSYPLFSVTEILGAVMKGTGNTVRPTVLTFLSICVLRIVLIFVMTLRHTTSLTIALCYPISWGVSSVMFAIYYSFGNWAKQR